MNWHPVALAIWLMLGISWLLYWPAAVRIIAILPRWQPMDSGAEQIRRERYMEVFVFQGRWVMILIALVAVLLVVGISNPWSDLVPGAMCGTGVLQALGAAGHQALIYHVVAVGILYAWFVIQGLDANHPRGRLTAGNARIFLLAAPLQALGGLSWYRAFDAIGSSPPVSCCAVVYARAGSDAALNLLPMSSGVFWLAACLAGALMVAILGAWHWRRTLRIRKGPTLVVTTVVFFWALTSVMALKIGVTPYIFQVLHHPCLWCLFLPEHNSVGFAYFGLLAMVVAEAIAMGAVGKTTSEISDAWIDPAAIRRCRQAGFRIMLGAGLFAIIVLWPILAWRVRYGVWLT
jgi:hypothetical protein